ncbi:MAG: antibiotic biosynthesis monooxygenase [Nitrospirae bacterium]|nr:antibiotic biosynthesis monooxygenase [Nitrospirota bacterium]
MTCIQGNPNKIHELARYEVRPESLDQCLAAIHEFVAYIRENDTGSLRYEGQDAEHPTRFVHIFVWRDSEGNRIHGESAAVKKFAGILYPNCLALSSSLNTNRSTQMPPSSASDHRSCRRRDHDRSFHV